MIVKSALACRVPRSLTGGAPVSKACERMMSDIDFVMCGWGAG